MIKQITLVIFITIPLRFYAQKESQKVDINKYAIITALTKQDWKGSGNLMGKEATFMMKWEKVLNNEFLKLEFENKRKSDDNTYIPFKANAYYKIIEDKIEGHWFDSRGVSFPLSGLLQNNSITIFWGTEETEKGKTVYTYTKLENIVVEDFIFKNGEYLKFGKATYIK